MDLTARTAKSNPDLTASRLTSAEHARLQAWHDDPNGMLAGAHAAKDAWNLWIRLWAAMVLSPELVICEALLAGVPVPTRRLDPAWVAELGLEGDVLLDEVLVLRINAN